MDDQHEASLIAADFRAHFDQYYLAVIPRLLNEDGLFLALLSMLTAVEALAGTYAPHLGTGERFRAFVSAYFPSLYGPFVESLWICRNKMVHSFNPGPFLLVCHQSRMHLVSASDVPMLNAEDFYADLIAASRSYFRALYLDPDLQRKFAKRMTEGDGGRPYTSHIIESVERRNTGIQSGR
ncbi:hypothetical protein D0B54_00580 [Solimonas sp. K1W22B-7]|nr:hypothetical protein D0B54_00580 [Solimonas sp. K1W22B-7]